LAFFLRVRPVMMGLNSFLRRPKMAQAALLVIDVQQSFLHREFWQEADVPAFQRNISALIEGCQAKGMPVVDVFHVAPQGPFSLASGWVKRMDFLQHEATFSVQKHVHNALTESGLLPWLQERSIDTLSQDLLAVSAPSSAAKPPRAWRPISVLRYCLSLRRR